VVNLVYKNSVAKRKKKPDLSQRKNLSGSRNMFGGDGEYWNKIAEQSETNYRLNRKKA